MEGVTSFSDAPLAFDTLCAGGSFILFVVSLVFLILRSVQGAAFRTDLALLTSFWFVAGLLFCTLRILGEYLYKTYMETKKRPRFHVETTTMDKEGTVQ